MSYFKEQVDFRHNHPDHYAYETNLSIFLSKAEEHIQNLESVGNYFNYNKTVDKGENYRTRIQRTNRHERMYREAYEWSKDWPDSKTHIEDVIGIRMPEKYAHEDDNELKFILEMLEESAYLTSVETIKARLIMEMIEAYENGWHMIFNTITVEPEHYEKVFEKGSTIWRNYIRKIQRQLATHLFGSWRKAGGEDYFHYCAVVEEGASNGRLHMHTMLFMKSLTNKKGLHLYPDPNYGLNPPNRREIDEMTWLWDYGHSQSIPIRFSNSDPWGKMGWAWPIQKNGQPIECSNIEKIATYMTKYILKAKGNTKGQASWRTKTDRKLGIRKLEKTLQQMPIKQLSSMVKYTRQPVPVLLNGNRIPHKLINNLATKELILRLKKKRIPLKCLPTNTTLKTLMQLGIQTKLDHNSTNIGDSLLQLFKGKDTSKANMKHFMDARKRLETAFRAEEYQTLFGGGNIDNSK